MDASCDADAGLVVPHREITAVTAAPLNVPLLAPFVISSGRLDAVHNVSVRIELADGSTGWGEIPLLPPVTPEDQPTALEAVQRVAPQLCGRLITRWRPLTSELLEALPHMPTVRAGLDMAIWDALARSWGVSLSGLFGGASDFLVTDITIPICPPHEARSLAASYRSQGFKKIKTKIIISKAIQLVRFIEKSFICCKFSAVCFRSSISCRA